MTASRTPTPRQTVLNRLGRWTMYLALGFIVVAKLLLLVAKAHSFFAAH